MGFRLVDWRRRVSVSVSSGSVRILVEFGER